MHIFSYRDDNPQPNVLLSFRIFSNLFLSNEGSALTLRHREKVRMAVFSVLNGLTCTLKPYKISLFREQQEI